MVFALYLRKCFYHVCALVPPIAVVVYWPLLLLAHRFKTLGDVYYAFTFAFSYYFVGEPIKPIREVLFSDLKDVHSDSCEGLKVLEIGPGTGSNFAYYPAKTRLTTVEINPYLEKHFNEIKVTFPDFVLENSVIGSAEDMSTVSDCSVDVVVGTHVLCCIQCPVAALKEIHRVLVPGGKYYFLELVSHPCAKVYKRKVQSLYAPIWKKFSMGCKAGDQDVDTMLDEAGFYSIDRHSYEVPELPVTHSLVHYGTAAKSNNGRNGKTIA